MNTFSAVLYFSMYCSRITHIGFPSLSRSIEEDIKARANIQSDLKSDSIESSISVIPEDWQKVEDAFIGLIEFAEHFPKDNALYLKRFDCIAANKYKIDVDEDPLFLPFTHSPSTHYEPPQLTLHNLVRKLNAARSTFLTVLPQKNWEQFWAEFNTIIKVVEQSKQLLADTKELLLNTGNCKRTSLNEWEDVKDRFIQDVFANLDQGERRIIRKRNTFEFSIVFYLKDILLDEIIDNNET